MVASITSPIFNVTSSSLMIELVHSYSFEYELDGVTPNLNGDAFDGANIEISSNGGAFVLFDSWDLNGYTPDIDGVDGLNDSGWSHISSSVVSRGIITGLTNGDNLQIRLNAGWDDAFFNPAPNWTITRLELNTVPEPSSALLLGLGALGFAARRRRTK